MSIAGYAYRQLVKFMFRLAANVLVVLVVLKMLGQLDWEWWKVAAAIWLPVLAVVPVELLILCWKSCEKPSPKGVFHRKTPPFGSPWGTP